MRARRFLTLTVVALLVFAACSDDKKSTTTSSSGGNATSSSSSGGGAGNVTVNVDNSVDKDTPVAYLAYFPNEVTVHPGDTVTFASHFSGEPHTVTFGTLVDQGIAKSDPNAQDEPAELKKIPTLLPDGPGDAVQASAQPCFLASGDPPTSDACTKDQQKQVDFDGTQTYYNSGFLADGDQFKVTLASDIKPGTYTYMCALHRAGMTGTVKVVAPDQKAQTAAEVKDAGEKQLQDNQEKMKTTIEAIKAGTLPPFIPAATPGQVLVGGLSQDVQSGLPVLVGPASTDVKVGDKVTFLILGPHTVTFGSDESLRTFISKSPDGSVHVNPASGAPAGGPGQTPPDPNAPPPADNAPPVNIDAGSYDGSGLLSSGVVVSFPPSLYTYTVTFTKAGSYSYVCLIHPDMKGTVNVT